MNIKIITGLAVISASLLLMGCTSSDMQSFVGNGSAASSSSTKLAPTNPAKVKLYYGNHHLPKNFQVVGQVSADHHNLVGIPHSQSSIAEELKNEAATLGANGVMNITNNFETTTGDAILSK